MEGTAARFFDAQCAAGYAPCARLSGPSETEKGGHNARVSPVEPLVGFEPTTY